jgi:hypothetical protein
MPEKPPANPGRRAPYQDRPFPADGGSSSTASGSLPLFVKIAGATFGTVVAPILVGLFLKYLDSRDSKPADVQVEQKSEATRDLAVSSSTGPPAKAAPAKAVSTAPSDSRSVGASTPEVALTSAPESRKASASASASAPDAASARGGEKKKSPASAASPAETTNRDSGVPKVEHGKLKKKRAAAAAAADPWQPSPGFTALFNGRDLTGWTGGDNRWTVDAKAHSLVGHDLTGSKGYLVSWIYTEKQFSDFRLRFEYRAMPQSDSGLAVRTAQGTRLDERYEIQLLGDQEHVIPTGTIIALRSDRAHPNTKPHAPVALRPQSDWNVVEIEFRGSRLKVGINGKAVQDVRFDQHADAKKIMGNTGRIAFQSRSGHVEFRRIELQELKGSPKRSSK